MYRVRQFFGALTSHIDEDEQELKRLLVPPQRELFRRMAQNDQRHSINVCAALRQAGYDDPDLLTAALLHDAGKAAGHIWLWQRTIIVLLERWAPEILERLAQGDYELAPWWRMGFVINRLHPIVGARWATEAGCSPTAVDLIRRHQDSRNTFENERDSLLAALQWADGVN